MTDTHTTDAERPSEHPGRVNVFYDGSCPLCRSEIAFMARQDGSEALNFRDISQHKGEVVDGLSCQQAMDRMHVQKPNGEIVAGARAFLVMWGSLPKYRWIARALSTPPLPTVLEGLYRAFLVIRPSLQWLARRNATSERTR